MRPQPRATEPRASRSRRSPLRSKPRNREPSSASRKGPTPSRSTPGEKYFTLAGGFQSGSGFKVRDSAKFVSKAAGKGGSFIRIVDPGPVKGLTAIDGFEITGYSQAIFRDYYESQRFDVTNNYIHDNACGDNSLVGGGVALNNISGTIKGNVFAKNSCGRGGALFLNDTTNQNSVSIESNLIEANAGVEPDAAHGGALYLFGNTLNIIGNRFIDNSVTQWGAGLYVGAFTPGNQPTTATLAWNFYRGNRAGDGGGGFFCDDGAKCTSAHEVYYRNCGGNILVDGGAGGSGPTIATFDHLTNVEALDVDCKAPGAGLFVDTYEGVAADAYAVTNAIFFGNAPERDLATACDSNCAPIKGAVSYSMAQSKYTDGSIKIAFGAGIIAPADPLFVAPDKGDFHLQAGSPAIGKGDGGSDLGAYGVGGAAQSAESAPAEPATPAPAKTAEEESPAPAAADPEPQAPALPGGRSCTCDPCPGRPERGSGGRRRVGQGRIRGRQGAWHCRRLECVSRELSQGLPCRPRPRLSQQARRRTGWRPGRSCCRTCRRGGADTRSSRCCSKRGFDRSRTARSRARRQIHGLPGEVQPLLHRPGLEAVADPVREPRRQRRRREPRCADVGQGRGRRRPPRHHDLFPARRVYRLLRVHQGDERHL